MGWPKRENIRARGILAVSNYFGAFDFADGSQLNPETILSRHYHHIFPFALVEEAQELFPGDILQIPDKLTT